MGVDPLLNFGSDERECIFPFYFKGKKYDECILYEELDFVYPLFVCPVQEVTTKTDGINDYSDVSYSDGLCPGDQSDQILDPNNKNCTWREAIPVFYKCKNNCPGVRGLGIIGLGLGGNFFAQSMCIVPYCRSRSNQCCLLVITITGLRCPPRC